MIRLRQGSDPVWYVAYGSNLAASRFACYLAGGRPPGSRRHYQGCRDPAPPHRVKGVQLTGRLSFGGVSGVWGGGLAFYTPGGPGHVAARAYQVTLGQLSDVVAQETRVPVGSDLVLDPESKRWPTGSSVYESVVALGDLEGLPMITLTSLANRAPAPPSAAYLRMIMAGLGETRPWSPGRRADYLLTAAGVAPVWTRARLIELCSPG